MLRFALSLALLAGLALGGVAGLARFLDGPISVFPGGPLRQGERVSGPVEDWSFAADVREVELQLESPPLSRNVWLVVADGRAYVPAGFMRVPLLKRWPHQALEDPRVVVRVLDKRYPLRAVRVTDPGEFRAVSARVARKYRGEDESADPDATWLFRLEPRALSAAASALR